ncbi:hypothetical protein Lepto7376_1116 [[Leptolyngbya] sp. PCC 7376]|uniref:hypothetical protein n=1 Tax=[Leptolyngbya] sp. PCC 7376 TaxID=111781 RepID=UPI00029F0966|nr:hypothetical protein [[Leptolyngbya] sp. PCC 7376]AFY37484.1 hypothetical protein Lepto7376_1116 [[Leptolyngbya] sp. PCC 7376]
MGQTRRSPLHRKTPSGGTNLWYIHYSRSHTDGQPVETELAYLRFFASQAQKLGLKLEILTHGEGEVDIESELSQSQFSQLDYRVIVSETPVLKWAEDSLEVFDDGTVAVPLDCKLDLLVEAMTEGRRSRWQRKIESEILEQILEEDHLWIPLGVNVKRAEMIPQQLAAAEVRGQSVQPLPAYIEGGNMLVGEDAKGQTLVLIGKDAIDATAHLKGITGDRLRELLAEEFKLESAAQIIPVEQPGQFHIDMGILFLGQGIVVVNDSEEALKNALEMVELAPCTTTETMATLTQLQHTLENSAVEDLRRAGLEVKRENLANGVFYNFCNGEFVEAKDGKNYYVTNGAAPEQEERFRELMIQEWQVVSDVIFSPRELTHKSLQERGGVGCRVKGACAV